MHFSTAVVTTLFAAGQLLSLVSAHIELKFPTPFRSKFLVPQQANTDFTNTAPLSPDGSNFPCKGYHHDDLPPTATLKAGSNFQLEYPHRLQKKILIPDCLVPQVIMEDHAKFL